MSTVEPVETCRATLLAAPVAMVVFAEEAGGPEVVAVNGLACELLGGTFDALGGHQFAEQLFDTTDRELLAAALQAASGQVSGPLLVRWGRRPPVGFLELRVRRLEDGSVAAAVVDRTDERRLDTFLASQGGGLFLEGLGQGKTLWLSPLTSQMMGIEPESVLGLDGTTYLHPDDLVRFRRMKDQAEGAPGSVVSGVLRYNHPDLLGSWFDMSLRILCLPDDPIVGAHMFNLSLTIETAGGGSDAPGASSNVSLSEIMPSGLVIAWAGKVRIRNNLARRMLGQPLEQDGAEAWVAALHPEHHDAVLGLLRAAVTSGRRGTVTASVGKENGAVRWLRIEAIPRTDGNGEPIGYVATLLDVTDETMARKGLEDAQSQLWQLANHDTLTGLPNRMQFNDRLAQAVARKRREEHEAAVLFCDLDRFKAINDRHGHHVGDQVLVEVARRLSSCTRGSDTVCRIGGDEFVVICEGSSADDVSTAVAARMIEAVSRPLGIDGVDATVGLSIGIAVVRPGESADQVCVRADNALYAAKDAGRGRYVVAD